MLECHGHVGGYRWIQEVGRGVLVKVVFTVTDRYSAAGEKALLQGRSVGASVRDQIGDETLFNVWLWSRGVAEYSRVLERWVERLSYGTNLRDGRVSGSISCRGGSRYRYTRSRAAAGDSLPARYRSGLRCAARNARQGSAGLSAFKLP